MKLKTKHFLILNSLLIALINHILSKIKTFYPFSLHLKTMLCFKSLANNVDIKYKF